jgi:DNA repair protein RadA/Sms
VLPESARGDVGGDGGLSLTTVGGLTSLVADIAARGSPKGNRQGNREENRANRGETEDETSENSPEKNATPARFRREGR